MKTDLDPTKQKIEPIPLNRTAKDLTNKQFGKVVALMPVRKLRGGIVWLCQCSCGNYTEVMAGTLTKGHTVSCGRARVLS